MFLTAALLLVGGGPAIYADDHWSYSTKLTKDNFDATVAAAVEGEHTLFVRWIASEG